MKASDFVSTSQERAENARNLLRTEETDAVNTGIVDTADKTVRGGTVLRKAAKGGVSNAALAAVTKGRSKDSGRGIEDTVADGSPEAAEGLASAASGRRALRSRLKGGAKGAGKAALANGIHKQLEGTELEGADDLYYKGKAGVRLVRRVRGRLSASKARRTLSLDGREAARPGAPLGGLSERRSKAAKNSVEAKRRAQMTRYFKRNVYSAAKAKTATAASASVSKGAAASVGGGLKAAVAALGGTTLLALLGLIALILLVAALGGGAGGRETNTSRSNYSSLTIVENQVASFFLSQGLDELHTAAIMGNMYAESGINPSSTETGGTGIGICQWSFDRASSLRSYASSQGKSWTDLSVQLDFFWNHDIWQTDWSGSYRIRVHKFDGDPAVGEVVGGSKTSFMAADDLTEATKQFCYGWERPGTPRINVRLEAAQRYYSALMAGRANSSATSSQRQAAIDAALAQVGKPYGHANDGYEWDCNGLTNYAWGQAGVSIPYPSGTYGYGQFQWMKSSGRWVTSVEQLQPGDLVFYSRDGGYHCYHVALYLGDNNVVHAVGYSHGVKVTSIWFCSGFCGGGSPV